MTVVLLHSDFKVLTQVAVIMNVEGCWRTLTGAVEGDEEEAEEELGVAPWSHDGSLVRLLSSHGRSLNVGLCGGSVS